MSLFPFSPGSGVPEFLDGVCCEQHTNAFQVLFAEGHYPFEHRGNSLLHRAYEPVACDMLTKCKPLIIVLIGSIASQIGAK